MAKLNASNNFKTSLEEDISDSDTTFKVDDLSDSPDTPYRVTIYSSHPSEGEIIEVTSQDEVDREITCDRGVEGTEAQSWDENTPFEHLGTAGMHEEIVNQLNTEEKLSDLLALDGSRSMADDLDLDNHSLLNVDNINSINANDLATETWVDDNYNDYSLETHDNDYHSTNYTDYDSSDFDSDFNNKDTDDLSEGSNLYFTDERVDDRVDSLLQSSDEITLDYNDSNNTLTIGESHSSSTSNPHDVSASQVGAPSSIDGVSNDGGDIDLVEDGNVTISTDDSNNEISFSVPDDLTVMSNYNTDDLSEGSDNEYFREHGNEDHSSTFATESWVDDNYNDYSLEEHDNSYHSTNYTDYDSSDFDTDFGDKDTDDLSEGSDNQYFTDSRAISAIDNDSSHGSDASHDYFSGSHSDLSNIDSSDHHSKYTDSEAVSAVDGSTLSEIEFDGLGSIGFGDGSQTAYDAAQNDHDDRFMFYIDEAGHFSNGFGLRTHDDDSGYGWMFQVDHNGDVYAGDDKVATENWVDNNYNDYSLETHGDNHHENDYYHSGDNPNFNGLDVDDNPIRSQKGIILSHYDNDAGAERAQLAYSNDDIVGDGFHNGDWGYRLVGLQDDSSVFWVDNSGGEIDFNRKIKEDGYSVVTGDSGYKIEKNGSDTSGVINFKT